MVYLNGVDTGRVANASFVDVPEGEYAVRLELPGYDPLERTGIRVQSGHVTTRHFNMTLAKGSCTVLSDVRGARIFIDGNETLCYANWTFDDIEVGKHTISLEKDGYDPVSQEVFIYDTNATVVFLGSPGPEAGSPMPATNLPPAPARHLSKVPEQLLRTKRRLKAGDSWISSSPDCRPPGYRHFRPAAGI
jgi:hypothetical protein